MKRNAFLVSAAAVLFLLQLVIVPGLAVAEAAPATDANWAGQSILAQPEGGLGDQIDEALESDPNFQNMSPEEQEQARQAARQMAEMLEGGGLAALGAVAIGGFIVGLIIAVILAFLLYGPASKIPAEHRKVAPGLVWLLIIPCINVIMNFIVLPNIAKGLKSYFDGQGRSDVGDCGAQLGMITAVLFAVGVVGTFVPILQLIAPFLSLAGLIMLIVVIVKFRGLASQISAGGGE